MSRATKWGLLCLLVAGGAWADRPPDSRPTDPRSSEALDPSCSGCEFLIDQSLTYAPAAGNREPGSVAFGGANYLAVWMDYRSNHAEVYGARIRPDGALLDSSGIAISASGADYLPAVAFDGVSFLVVWTDTRNGSTDIYGARVSVNGDVLDPQGIPISTDTSDQDFPAVVSDGTRALVVWSDNRNGLVDSDIYGARVGRDGVVLDPLGFPVSQAGDRQFDPAVTSGVGCFFVVWEDWRNWLGDVYGARVSSDGVVLDRSGIPISTGYYIQEDPAAAFDGTNFLVAWVDEEDGIYGARVSLDGVVLDTSGIDIAVEASVQRHPAVAFDGTNYMVAWDNWRDIRSQDIHGARLTPAGVVLDPSGIAVSTATGEQISPGIGSDGSSVLVVWQDWRNGAGSDIYGARVAPTGSVLDTSGLLVSASVESQYYPAVASNGAASLVVWEARRGELGKDIYGARVGTAGVALDSAGFPISAFPNDQYSPSVASDGADFLVVWADRRNDEFESDIRGCRVTAQGRVLDSAGIPVTAAPGHQESPAAAFDGTNFLVVWGDTRNGVGYDVYGTRVTPNGEVLDPEGIAVSTAASNQLSPAVCPAPSGFLVAWEDCRDTSQAIYGTRVTTEGRVVSQQGIRLCSARGEQEDPAIASDGTDYFAAWLTLDLHSEDGPNVFGAGGAFDGKVPDPGSVAISTASGAWNGPVVVFDGSGFVVAWEGQDSTDYSAHTDYHIHGARVSPNGVLVDTFPIAVQNGDQRFPSLASCAGAVPLVVYQGWAGTVGGKTYNANRIWGKFGPFSGQRIKTPRSRRADSLVVSPNPFSNACRIRLDLSRPSPVSLNLHDASGRVAGTVFKGEAPVGTSWFDFQAADFAAGVYFLRLETSYRRTSTKLVLTE